MKKTRTRKKDKNKKRKYKINQKNRKQVVEGYILNIRAGGIITHNGKILLHHNLNKDHYAILGGRMEIGESSEETVKREYKEELGKDVEIKEYIATIENFFEIEKKKYHEIMFIYKLEFVDDEDKKI